MIKNQVIVSDFSFWQDDDYTPYKIDFTTAYKAGLDGTILRAGQNTWIDEDFIDYCRNADKAGLPRGAYWFFDSRVSPIPQADLFADIVESAGEFPKLGIWGDYEENYGGVYGGQKNFKIFMERLEARFPGKIIGVYTGPSYWREHTTLTGAFFFGKYPLWIAHYGVYQPDVPFPWGKQEWTFWQFTANGDGPMFGAESEEIDMNYFGGTLEEYKTFFNIPDYEPSTPPEETGEDMKIYRVLATTTPYANLRATPNGTDIGDVYPSTEFSSDREELDTLGRPWLHSTSPEGFVLKSLCEFVRDVEDPTPTPCETHVLEVFVDGVLKYKEEF
jgi:GH25 family lysozyme M1 (1,4-beta-N-acetylmuramidase)